MLRNRIKKLTAWKTIVTIHKKVYMYPQHVLDWWQTPIETVFLVELKYLKMMSSLIFGSLLIK